MYLKSGSFVSVIHLTGQKINIYIMRLVLIAIALCSGLLLGQQDEFVGSKICSNCHLTEYDSWLESTHAKAGGKPTADRILAPFDGVKIEIKNGWFIPYKKNNRYFFRAQENGFPEKKYEVVGVVGGGFLYGGGTQTYFGFFPDGTMRLLPFDYHPGNRTWFFESNDLSGWVPVNKKISPRQMSEWPPNRVIGAIEEQQNCQQCHGSQIVTSFTISKGAYTTNFTELSINCESCHGPGKEHVSLMQYGKTIVKGYTGISSLTTLSKEEGVNVCSQCHALKDMIRPGYLPGMDFENYFSTKFSMLGNNPYYPDGRVRAFGYQQNHVFSDCYINGSMTCVDCHNPHSNSYQDINRNPLKGRFDNGQCTSCHISISLDISNHTFHNENSLGSQCTSCHMPFQQHRAVGDYLKFARADHTISIPRPDLDEKFGITNACVQCHSDLSNKDISNQIMKWYGKLKPLNKLESALVSFLDGKNSMGDLVNLIGDNSDPSPQLFAGLATAYMSDHANRYNDLLIKKLKNLSTSNDLDIKSVSLAYLDLLSEYENKLPQYLINILSKSGKDQGKIRSRWSTALAYKAQELSNQQNFSESIKLYNKSLTIWPNNQKARKGLAAIYLLTDDYSNAVMTYGEVVKINKADWNGWSGLANSQARNGQFNIALEAYMKSLEINTHNASAHLGIGDILYKMKNYNLAEQHLARAIELDPEIVEGYIFLAAVKVKQNDYKNASLFLSRGLILNPDHAIGKTMKRELTNIE